MQVEQIKKVMQITEEASIGGKASTVTAKVDFNPKKGTVSINLHMTTKQISFDEQQVAEANGIATRVMNKAYGISQDLIKDWLENNRPGYDPNQGNLFDIIKNGGGLPEEEDDEVGEPLGQDTEL